MKPLAVVALLLLLPACRETNSAAGIEARALRAGDHEFGCAFPGPITAAACDGASNGWCLVCWREGENPGYPSVCVSVRADGCR